MVHSEFYLFISCATLLSIKRVLVYFLRRVEGSAQDFGFLSSFLLFTMDVSLPVPTSKYF